MVTHTFSLSRESASDRRLENNRRRVVFFFPGVEFLFAGDLLSVGRMSITDLGCPALDLSRLYIQAYTH